MTQEEILALVAESAKGINSQVREIIEENKRLSIENEALKNPSKKPPVTLATKAEIDAVYGVQATEKPESEKTNFDKTLDDIIKWI